MGRKGKYTYEVKKGIVERCIAGETNANQEAKKLGIRRQQVSDWIDVYEAIGEEGLMATTKNTPYTAEQKIKAVKDYINGEGSQKDICKRYKIRSKTQLRNWIKKYNRQEELKTYGTGGYRKMGKGRKTTLEERIEIVEYCISHENNYVHTAKEYDISYQQARNYTKKYQEKGIEGLKDKRGKRKREEEMNEVERLKAENKLLKAEIDHAQMEIYFLKKLKEIEGRWV